MQSFLFTLLQFTVFYFIYKTVDNVYIFFEQE